VLILWGNPIHIDTKASRGVLEEKKRELEDTLTRLTQEADIAACGK